jgi:hypothetical protein
MPKISVLQRGKPVDIGSGTITKQSLAYLSQSPDFPLDKLVTKLYKSDHLVGVSDYLKYINKTRIVPRNQDRIVTWQLQGSSMKTVPLQRATTIAGEAFTAASIGSSGAGFGKQEFFLYFASREFTDVQILVGPKGSKYKFHVQDDPEEIGTEFRYRVKLWGANPNLYVPYELLTLGTMFSVDGSPVESTLSKKGSGFNFTSNFTMQNRYTMARFQDIIPANMVNRAVQWAIKVGDQTFTVWDDYASWERKRQMKVCIDRLINYGTINSDEKGRILDKGKSGFVIEMGSGIEEQMESGNKFSYSKFSIKALESIIMDLSDNMRGFAEKRNVLIRTGKWGAMLAQNLIKQEALAFTPLQSDKFLSSGPDGGYSLNTTFTSYTTQDGTTLTFQVDPMFDDVSDARTSIPMSDMCPGLPGPATSYTYQILNVGSEGGENNLEICYVETDQVIYGYKPGPRSPYAGLGGGKYGTQYAIDDDGFGISMIAPEFSVVLRDPTRTMIMKPSILE